jgi:rSAM/selenodomain-associated transferase 1
MRPVIILFAKAPVPGRVKTRLAGAVGPQRAAELHSAFVLDSVEKLTDFQNVADLELHTDTPTDAWPRVAVTRALQCEGDLGLKMFHRLNHELGRGRPQAVIIGSDAPTLPGEYVRELLASAADVALGPTEDGGYYAIACRKVHPRMFEGVHWSTSVALNETEQAALGCGLTIARGKHWYDVDERRDLLRLGKHRDLPRHTQRWWKKHSHLLD